MTSKLWLGYMIAFPLAACGGTVSTTGSGGATMSNGATTSSGTITASSSSSGAGGSANPPGECKQNSDCPPDGTCVELIAGGYRVCQFPTVEATVCTAQGQDECCSTADCTKPGDKCIFGPFPGSCGGALMLPRNQCVKDLCAAPADCKTDEICAPAGTLGSKVRVCLAAPCKQATCLTSQENVGWCAAIKSPCCAAPLGVFCAKGCLTDVDCPNGYCDVDPQGLTVCKPGGPICPG